MHEQISERGAQNACGSILNGQHLQDRVILLLSRPTETTGVNKTIHTSTTVNKSDRLIMSHDTLPDHQVSLVEQVGIYI